MEGYLSLLIVNFVIYLDARTLQQEAEDVYTEIMKYSPRKWTILTFLLFIVVAPLYYYRRHKFLTRFHSRKLENLSVDVSTSAEIPCPQEPNPHFSRIIETTGVVLYWFFWLVVLSVLYLFLAQIFPILNTNLLQYAVLGELSSVVMICLIYRAIKKYRTEGFWKSLSVKKGTWFFVKSLLFPGAIGLALAVVNFGILSIRGTGSSSPLSQALGGGNLLSLVVFLGMGILTAPLLEELIFRGYFFSAIQQIKGKPYAVGSITLLFTLFHVEQLWGDWLGILLIVGLAFCLTVLRAWSGSTIPGIVTHYTYNTSVILILPLLALYLASPAYFTYTFMSAKLDDPAKQRLLEQSITTHPEYIPAYNALAWMYAEQETSLDSALNLIETALESEPDNPMYLDTKAEILYKLQRYDEAIDIERTLVNQYPSIPFYQEQLKKYMTAKSSERK
jgi:membrane protease YdiL (CAAX protease family)